MFSDPYSHVGKPAATAPRLQAELGRLTGLVPGLVLALAATLAAYGLSAAVGGPVMLYAIIVGMALNPVLHGPATKAGIQFSAKTILNIGVALLGVKIALADIAGLGWETAALVMVCVGGTILSGIGVGRLLGLKSEHAVLSSGAVAICGASAAMALCAALPQTTEEARKESERNTLVTVMGVTLLGTFAMVLYPALAHILGLSETQAGIFIGATIHNVAQVVGAGFMISEPVGDTATIVKLMRVACLVPVIAIVTLAYRRRASAASAGRDDGSSKAKPALVPSFLIGFIALVAINSLGLIPAALTAILSDVSSYALVMAIAALGVKTSVSEMFKVGGSACLILVVQTVLLAAVALSAVLLVPAFA
ncbi:MAG: putative sulfate exporter family transporter [Pseudomonadota bacterium]